MNHVWSRIATAAMSVLGGAVLFGAIAPTASAISLVPTQEGEIDFNAPINLGGISYTVESLDFTVTKGGEEITTQSRLFVDKAGTENSYSGGVEFAGRDIGTSDNNNAFWFRPSATIMRSNGSLLEAGQLETGRFLFNFATPLEQLVLTLFDVEKSGTTITQNGSLINGRVANTGNNKSTTFTLANVSSLELMLGNGNTGGRNATGDGVLMQMTGTPSQAVPEPASMLGIAAAGAGLTALRRRQKQQAAD